MDDSSILEAPPAAPAPAPAPNVGPIRSQVEGLSAMAQALVDAGHMTQEQAQAALAAELADEGAENATDAAAAALKRPLIPEDPEEAALARAMALPDDPAGYEFYYDGPIDLTPEQRELDGNMRGWLLDVGVPKVQAPALSQVANRHAKAWHAMDAVARELSDRSARVTLERMWGSNFEANTAKVSAAIASIEAKRPGVVAFLERNGLASNPEFVAMIFNSVDYRAR